MPRVLVADDDRAVREALMACIRSLGLEPEGVSSGDEALPLLDRCDLMISDMRMPGMDGMALLGEARRRRPELPVIMLTGHGTVDLAVQAMRLGAANFLEKPFEIDDLEQAVRSALQASAAPAAGTAAAAKPAPAVTSPVKPASPASSTAATFPASTAATSPTSTAAAFPASTTATSPASTGAKSIAATFPASTAAQSSAASTAAAFPASTAAATAASTVAASPASTAAVAPAATPTVSSSRGAAAPAARASDIFIGESVPAQELRSLARRVAASEATVLVTGESGSGKEVVARTIHLQSRRAKLPFVAVNCGAIPETLLESELFGHVKGAFTGATQTRIGRFGAAEGGTLLLDEIGEMPLHLQVKLLRVLQERGYTPVGASETRPADVRVIAATNRDLEAMVAAGTFREDLFYRLNVLSVAVPPLRERGDDILQLARTFLRRASDAEGKSSMSFDDDVVLCLKRYAWPGNVRELEHAITRATVLAQDTTVTLADLPVKVRGSFFEPQSAAAAVETIAAPALGEDGVDLNAALERVERQLIHDALERTGGNKNRAAALLRIRRTTLVEKLKRLGTEPR